MSLINDALKQARQHPPAGAHPPTSPPMTPLQPVAHKPVPVAGWLIPAIVIFLIVAAVFFMGWAMANRSVISKAVPPPMAAAPIPAPAPVESAPVAIVAPPVVAPAPEPPSVAVAPPPPLPVLQGIFYSATAPSAIVDGKTIYLGDSFKQYRVKEITRSTVTLVDAEGKPTKLIMGN